MLIQYGARDDTTCVDGVNGRDDERDERLVHILVGNASNLTLAVSLIELLTLNVVGSHGVGRLITRVRWDFQVLVGEGMLDRWSGHLLEVPIKGVGVVM